MIKPLIPDLWCNRGVTIQDEVPGCSDNCLDEIQDIGELQLHRVLFQQASGNPGVKSGPCTISMSADRSDLMTPQLPITG